jgi:hypothetical protein
MKGARIWIICDLLHDLTINLVPELAVRESYPSSQRASSSLGEFAAVLAPFSLSNGAERAHSIFVWRPRKIKQRCGKRATLPNHHLPDRDLALQDGTGAVRREVLLRELGLDELLDIRGEVMW